MNTLSIWQGTDEDTLCFESFSGTDEADAVIIGGGISGLICAMLLSREGKKVVLLEALRIGLGTTGNSTGNLYSVVDENLSKIKKKWNSRVLRDVVQSRSAAIDLVEETVRKYEISCDFYRTSFNYFVEKPDKDTLEFLREEHDAMEEAGLKPVKNINPGLPFEVKSALSADGQAQFHPLKFVRGLARALSGKCFIYEHSLVTEIDEKKGLVITSQGRVKAKHIIMATHTPKGVYLVHSVLGPYREHGVAAELNTGFPKGIFWGLDQPKHSIRSLEANGKNYIMVIGDKYKTGHAENTFDYVERLKKYLEERVQVKTFPFVWGGQHYRPADGLPYIGHAGDNVYILTGFATDGLVYGTLGAMIISDEIVGKDNPWKETFRFGRFTPLKSAREFIKENVDTVFQYLKDYPWTDHEEIKKINHAEAKVIEKGGEKVAVYRDEQGELHIVSAVCTHMKCIVNWNAVEKSWDCPCHGSRFRFDGTLLEGPAINNLEKKAIKQKI